MVLATQNPLEYLGTFPLPESQLDRFLISLRIGYPPRADERELLGLRRRRGILERLQPAVSREEPIALQARVGDVRVADKLTEYILTFAEATRRGGDFLLGVSTRGARACSAPRRPWRSAKGATSSSPTT